VENAVKVARVATGRPAVVVFDHGYHGRTLLTMTLTAKYRPYKAGFGPYAPEIYRAPMAYPFRWPGGADRCADEAYDRFVDVVTTQVGADRVACVVVEPIQGEGGFVVPAPGFLRRVADFCAEHGILLVADEVQTGFGRTGDWFASTFEGIEPDLVTTAKGIAGGLPLGGLTGRAELMDAVHVSGLGGTFGGNPVACAAALAVLDELSSPGFRERAEQIATLLRTRLDEIAARQPVVGEVRGLGAMLALELAEQNGDAAKAVTAAARDKGLVLLSCGLYGNVIRLLPPLTATDEELERGLSILERSLSV
jgi:4-aminobutyrate aminotransferase/(S)-3-amino-2-methylpropionate transaminase